MRYSSFYRSRNFLFDHLIEKMPVDAKKNSPRELLKQGYWSNELGDHDDEVKKYWYKVLEHKSDITKGKYDNLVDQKNILMNEDPLKLSEITRFSTWFAMHPEKVAGKEKVTTSLFFPVKIEGTQDDVIRVIKNGINGNDVEPAPVPAPAPEPIPEPVAKKVPSLLKMKMKAKALKLKLRMLETSPAPISIKPRNDNEIVTRLNTDMQKEYDFYNKLCFDGKLQNVPLEWNMNKGKLGFVMARGNRFNLSSYIVLKLSISLFNQIDYKSFVDTLVHEMIHVYIITNAIKDTGSHGRDSISQRNGPYKQNEPGNQHHHYRRYQRV